VVSPTRPILAATVVAALAGCVTTSVETSDGRPPPPQPRAAPATPADAPITDVAAVLGPKPLDTNGNLRPDTIQVELYLFARPYPSPTMRDGSFEISLYPMGQSGSPDAPAADPLRTWTVGPDAVRAARAMALAGPCYRINLSLLDGGQSDDLGVSSVDLTARFRPTGEDAIVIPMRGVRTVSLKGASDLFQTGPVTEINERPGAARQTRETRIEAGPGS